VLRRDLSFYRSLLCGLSFGELVALYERTLPEYAALAQVIAEELEQRQDITFKAAA
jgi:hypothetical protein